jgi:hypothetical protein
MAYILSLHDVCMTSDEVEPEAARRATVEVMTGGGDVRHGRKQKTRAGIGIKSDTQKQQYCFNACFSSCSLSAGGYGLTW